MMLLGMNSRILTRHTVDTFIVLCVMSVVLVQITDSPRPSLESVIMYKIYLFLQPTYFMCCFMSNVNFISRKLEMKR